MQRLINWILDGVVAVLSILAIVSYFFAPVWSVNVNYPISGDDLKEMLASSVSKYDLGDAFQEGLDLKVSIDIETSLVFSSLGSNAETTVQKVVEGNVENVVNQLSVPLGEISRKVVHSVAKQVVREKVNEQVKSYLQNNSESVFQDEEISQKLQNAGIDDTYIGDKTTEIFDFIYENNANVEQVSEMVVDTVEEAYGKLVESGDPDFQNAALTEEDKKAIKDGVADALEELTGKEGTLNPDEIIDQFLLEFMKDKNNSASALRVAPCAAEDVQSSSAKEELIKEIRIFIMNQIKDLNPVIVWGLRGLLGLILISAASWIYILVKLAVKLIKNAEDNTVKLKMPIILGWLPYLFLGILPSLALLILRKTPIAASGGALEILSSLSVSFASIGWVALLCAAFLVGISIYFIVVRKHTKQNGAASKDIGSESTSSDFE